MWYFEILQFHFHFPLLLFMPMVIYIKKKKTSFQFIKYVFGSFWLCLLVTQDHLDFNNNIMSYLLDAANMIIEKTWFNVFSNTPIDNDDNYSEHLQTNILKKFQMLGERVKICQRVQFLFVLDDIGIFFSNLVLSQSTFYQCEKYV